MSDSPTIPIGGIGINFGGDRTQPNWLNAGFGIPTYQPEDPNFQRPRFGQEIHIPFGGEDPNPFVSAAMSAEDDNAQEALFGSVKHVNIHCVVHKKAKY